MEENQDPGSGMEENQDPGETSCIRNTEITHILLMKEQKYSNAILERNK
jgi:hypothetical protein